MNNIWTCPYCHQPQPLTTPMRDFDSGQLKVQNKYGKVGYRVVAISCANMSCREVEVTAWYGTGEWVFRNEGSQYFRLSNDAQMHRIRPQSSAKPLPDYINQVLVEDYEEACSILNLSPKASATLSRRCLQGMIRDFCGISRSTLDQEIKALEELDKTDSLPKGVNSETVAAMHHLRKVGNIGAHMEPNINVIVDVKPQEAQALVDVIEMLFDEWYVERKKRSDKLKAIEAISNEKTVAKMASPKAVAAEPDGSEKPPT